MKKALLTAWHNSSAASIIPVLERMRKGGKYEPRAIVYGPAKDVLYKKGLPIIPFADNDDGVTLDRARWIIEYFQPKVVIGGTSPPGRGLNYAPEQLLFRAASEKGVRTVSLIDYWEPQIRYDDITRGVEGKLAFMPDKIAALDESSKRLLLEAGIPQDRIEITGNPQHDALVSLKNGWNEDKKREARQKLGLPEERMNDFLVVLMGSIRADMKRDKTGFWDLHCTDIACSALSGLDKQIRERTTLRVMKHPGEDSKVFGAIEALANSYGVGTNIIANADPYSGHPDTISLAANLLVGARSNMLVAATMMDLNAFSLQPGIKDKDPIITNRLGLTAKAYTTEEGIDLLQKAVINSEEFFSGYKEKRKSFKASGQATDNVMELLERLI